MTTTQRDGIASPATGLQVYNTTTNAIEFYNGTAWTSGGGGGGISGSGASGQIAYWTGSTSQAGSATLTYTPTSSLLVNNSITAASAIARGVNLTPALTAAANSDVLVGLDIAPTFTNGAFTGVANYGLRLSNSQAFFGGSGGIAMFIASNGAIRGDAATNGTMYIDSSRDLTGNLFLRATTLNFPSGTSTTSLFNITATTSSFSSNSLTITNNLASFRLNNILSATTWYFENNRNAPSGSLEISNSLSNPTITAFSTRNVAINSNTDAGYKLDVNGTARVSGDTTIGGVLIQTVTTNRQTASYTLVLADRGKLVEMNVATANNLTVPLNSSVAFPIGTQIDLSQYGAGQTTVVATGGVTIRSTNSWVKLNAQYAGATLIKIGTDEWYLFGNLNA
jgi:hypothetical protein